MSGLTPHTAVSTWVERAIQSDDLPLPAYFQKDGSGDWILATTGPQEGVCVDDGSGDYVLVDIEVPTELEASGSDYTFGTTAVANLVADGSDITISTDLTEDVVAILGQDLAGNVVMVRNTGQSRLLFLSIDGNYLGYQDT